MNKWEYKKEYAYMDKMNALGVEGWELCLVDGGIAYFKRPLIEEKAVKPKVVKPNKEAPFEVGDWVAFPDSVMPERAYWICKIASGFYVKYEGKQYNKRFSYKEGKKVIFGDSKYTFVN